MKLRIKFAKTGVMKFVGHLDMMRYFQKAIRRAEIDVVYSGGYSPHQIMSFAAPLGVGLESQGEYFDLEVDSLISTEDLKVKLNAVMSEGVTIINVKILPENAGNAMASVSAAKYKVCFRKGHEPMFDWISQLSVFYQKPIIPVQKKTKKSEKELDLKPFIYEMEVTENAIIMLVDASSAGNIKPTLVMEAFFSDNGLTLGEFDLEITRLETYLNIGTAVKRELVPLDAIGYDNE